MTSQVFNERFTERFRLLNEVSQRIISILTLEDLLAQVVRLIQASFKYYHVAIGLIEGDAVVYRVGAGELWDNSDFDFRPSSLKVGKEGVTGWVAASGIPLLVPDVKLETRYIWMQGSQTQSEMTIPIVVKGSVIGVLDIQSDQLNDFDETDLDFMQSLANQTGIAIENARLYASAQHRAEQFRVLTEVSQQITSILDIDDLIGRVVRLIQETFGYYHVSIGLIDGDDLVFRVGAGIRAENSSFHFEPDRLKIGLEGVTGWVARHGEALLVPEVSLDSRYISMQDALTRSELVVPIRAQGETIGVLDVQSQQPADFDQTDLELMQSLASQTGIAIENARLYASARRRAEQFRVMTEVSQRISSILDINVLLQQLVQMIQSAFDYYHVEIGLVEGDEIVFHVGAGELWETGDFQASPDRLKIGQGVSGIVAATGTALNLPDVSQDPRYVPVQRARTRSELTVPIIVNGRVIGVVDVESDQLDHFDETDLELMTLLANQAGVALENARLYRDVKKVAALEERQHLARELHDSVTQSLYGITLYSQAASGHLAMENHEQVGRHLDQIHETSQEALAEMRLLIYQLRPLLLEREGLLTALQARLSAVEGRAGVKTSLKSDLTTRLPFKLEEGLYHIAQEALNNTMKHAHASSVDVRIRCSGPLITMEIVDNGVGFDPSETAREGRMGLPDMEEHARELGGTLTIKSELGHGTRIKVDIPL